uniref:Uncharacterized protein n=1 Tax=Branchiostoma floridae TaxID=7739 RepID=C3YBB8_BRAFL|eukprot:XP_002606265.1 hypothetical protein BRAFLDRAFT_83983 [Branchiostoma floridae]
MICSPSSGSLGKTFERPPGTLSGCRQDNERQPGKIFEVNPLCSGRGRECQPEKIVEVCPLFVDRTASVSRQKSTRFAPRSSSGEQATAEKIVEMCICSLAGQRASPGTKSSRCAPRVLARMRASAGENRRAMPHVCRQTASASLEKLSRCDLVCRQDCERQPGKIVEVCPMFVGRKASDSRGKIVEVYLLCAGRIANSSRGKAVEDCERQPGKIVDVCPMFVRRGASVSRGKIVEVRLLCVDRTASASREKSSRFAPCVSAGQRAPAVKNRRGEGCDGCSDKRRVWCRRGYPILPTHVVHTGWRRLVKMSEEADGDYQSSMQECGGRECQSDKVGVPSVCRQNSERQSAKINKVCPMFVGREASGGREKIVEVSPLCAGRTASASREKIVEVSPLCAGRTASASREKIVEVSPLCAGRTASASREKIVEVSPLCAGRTASASREKNVVSEFSHLLLCVLL